MWVDMKHKLLLIIVCLMALAHEAYAQKIYVLAVGVADYPGERNDLRLPAKDARKIEWIYEKNKKAETKLLTDSQATKANVLKEMNAIYSKAKDDDIIVLFFSGHGMPGSLCAYDEFIAYDDIRKVMATSASKHKMIFADACYSGNMRTEENRSENVASSKDLDVMLFLSSRSDETSIESGYFANGFFTMALELGLRGKADKNEDRIITAKELFVFVSEVVRKLSSDKQHPVMWGKFDDDMPVIKW